ncbi:MAG: LysR family transcriptional regulator [Pseudonocardiaceae bacterium]|nr:LysR family transcriptional regulator [Pseudonocardiaceae bacterium]
MIDPQTVTFGSAAEPGQDGRGRSQAHLANLDLNLLVFLRELIRERNVTRAAERIGVTQPTASAALSRLRRHFDDELLVRVRGGYLLSPLAVQLAEQVDTVCAAVERIFAANAEFDPATSEREFNLIMADYAVAVLGERLSQLMDATAPLTRLHIMLVKESLVSGIAETIRFVDGVVAPPTSRFALPDFRSVELFRDRWVCLTAADNPAIKDGALHMDDLERLSWVAPYHRDSSVSSAVPITRQLALLGLRPRIAVRVESYQAVPYFVAGTERIALMQERLAAKFANRLDLRILECPGEPEPIVEKLWWHERVEDDPAHRWFRQLIAGVAAQLDL